MLKRCLLAWMICALAIPVYAANKLVSMDLDNVSLHYALQMIAQMLSVNLVVSGKIKGNVSLHLSHSSPTEAFNTLVAANDLTSRKFGATWIVEPRSQWLRQGQQQLDLQKISEETSPYLTRIWQVHYAKAEDIAKLFQDNNNSLLSKHGHVRVDLRTNSLCVQETAKQLRALYYVVKKLDIPIKQVMIKTRLTSIDTEFERELGLRFESRLVKDAPEAKVYDNESPIPRYSLAIAKLADGSLLDVKLTALENEGHGELISSPRLFTANQQTASIESGEEIPYQETSRNGATSIAFKKAVLSLKVTPQIMPDHRILLQLQVNQDKPTNHMVLGVPAINTRQITTNVLVKNGETIVLGGIYESNQEKGYQRIPFLGKIPLLGLLFQQMNSRNDKRELLIFVTPKIVG